MILQGRNKEGKIQAGKRLREKKREIKKESKNIERKTKAGTKERKGRTGEETE